MKFLGYKTEKIRPLNDARLVDYYYFKRERERERTRQDISPRKRFLLVS